MKELNDYVENYLVNMINMNYWMEWLHIDDLPQGVKDNLFKLEQRRIEINKVKHKLTTPYVEQLHKTIDNLIEWVLRDVLCILKK